MNGNTDFDRIAQSWLQDGPTEMPDRSLQAALDEVHVTSQQRFGAARRAIPMNGNTWRVAAAAVIGLLIILGGITFLGGRQGGVGGPTGGQPHPNAPPRLRRRPSSRKANPWRSSRAGTPSRAMGPIPVLVYGAIRLGRKRNPSSGRKLETRAAAPFLLNQPFDHGFTDPCTDHTPVLPASWNRSRRAPRCHRRSAGHRRGPDHGRERGRPRREGRRLHRAPTRPLPRAGDGQDGFWIWGWCPAPVTVGCEDSTGERRFGVSQNDRERAYAIEVDGKVDTFLHEPAG